MSYNCQILEQEDQPVLSICTRSAVKDLPSALGRAYGAIAQYLQELGESPSGAPFTGYYNMDMQNLDLEIGFPVASVLAGRGEIQSGHIPGGKVATTIYTGPYNAIEPAYNALTAFMQKNGHKATGVAYEFYLNDPGETPAEELQTKILFPLK